ncbi:MAG: phosphopantothenoylcysteine decarboxylase [Candidatus Omnitrophica bacterium]|nr:phosphopantothenoylcysteine decarboxylase [Candidatus Omnitrophota bacterium]
MNNGLKGKKILITSGPTSVAIDEMRVITNRSTGEMGRLIANACMAQGARVTLVEGAATTTVPLVKGSKVVKFFLFDELEMLFKAELKKKPDVVIHAAAVSDFRLKKIFKGKVSSCDQITLNLAPTKKLIGLVKKLAPHVFLVGFKLEVSLAKAIKEAESLMKGAGCDLVIANSCSSEGYRACVVDCKGSSKKTATNKQEIVKYLIEEIHL